MSLTVSISPGTSLVVRNLQYVCVCETCTCIANLPEPVWLVVFQAYADEVPYSTHTVVLYMLDTCMARMCWTDVKCCCKISNHGDSVLTHNLSVVVSI